MSERREPAEGKWPVTVANFTLIIGALVDFLGVSHLLHIR